MKISPEFLTALAGCITGAVAVLKIMSKGMAAGNTILNKYVENQISASREATKLEATRIITEVMGKLDRIEEKLDSHEENNARKFLEVNEQISELKLSRLKIRQVKEEGTAWNQ